jgi:hypothetical protein
MSEYINSASASKVVFVHTPMNQGCVHSVTVSKSIAPFHVETQKAICVHMNNNDCRCKRHIKVTECKYADCKNCPMTFIAMSVTEKCYQQINEVEFKLIEPVPPASGWIVVDPAECHHPFFEILPNKITSKQLQPLHPEKNFKPKPSFSFGGENDSFTSFFGNPVTGQRFQPPPFQSYQHKQTKPKVKWQYACAQCKVCLRMNIPYKVRSDEIPQFGGQTVSVWRKAWMIHDFVTEDEI